MDIAHPDPSPRAAAFMTALYLRAGDIVAAETWLMELIAWLSFDARDYRLREDAPMKVLVAEDAHDAAEVECALLDYLGHEATATSTSSAALEAAARVSYDVVIIDVDLPDALDVIRQLRLLPQRPYIACFSGWATDADRRRAMDAGCDEYVVKPVDLAKLKTVVMAALRGTDGVPLR